MDARDKWARLLEIASGAPRPAIEVLPLEDALALSAEVAPEIVGCSVTEMAGPNYRTPAFWGQTALSLDIAQYAAGTGPCVAAARDRQPQLIVDLAEDRRYAHFSNAALDLGVRSALSIPMAGTFRPAATNFYAREPDVLAAEHARAVAVLLTRCLSVLMGGPPPSENAGGAGCREDAVQARSAGDEVRSAVQALVASAGTARHVAYGQLVERARSEARHISAVAHDVLTELEKGTHNG
jgi:hypothetical protein